MGAKLLNRREGFVGEERLCVHAAKHRVVHLTDGSDETASTPKIVSDARDLQFDLKMRSAPWRARQPSKEKPREAAFPKREATARLPLARGDRAGLENEEAALWRPHRES
jgi:hypothetical protein